MTPGVDWTGLVPLGAVDEASGRLPAPLAEDEESSSPRFAKAIAAIRRTTTPTTVTRLREDERPVRRAPPYTSVVPPGRWVRVWPVPP